MPAPLSRFFAFDTEAGRFQRQIDNHYHLEVIATDGATLRDYLHESLDAARNVALANQTLIDGLTEGREETYTLLTNLTDTFGDVASQLHQSRSVAEATLHQSRIQTDILEEGFARLEQRLFENRETLQEIAESLRRPYETHALECLREAERALQNGMSSVGRDRDSEFADASALLGQVVTNPIGQRNYVAHFQLGWLAWKYKGDIQGAEESFYHAARLSSTDNNLYHVKSLRHQAYMQYLKGQYRHARDTIQRALDRNHDDCDVRYDAARYEARLNEFGEATRLLASCIDTDPSTIVSMLAEGDFAGMTGNLTRLVAEKTRSARAGAAQEVAALLVMVWTIRRIAKEVDLDIEVVERFGVIADGLNTAIADADYLVALELARDAARARDELQRDAKAFLSLVIERSDLRITEAQEAIVRAAQARNRSISAAEDKARADGTRLFWELRQKIGYPPTPLESLPLGICVSLLAIVLTSLVRSGVETGRPVAFCLDKWVIVAAVAGFFSVPVIIQARFNMAKRPSDAKYNRGAAELNRVEDREKLAAAKQYEAVCSHAGAIVEASEHTVGRAKAALARLEVASI